jgi:hypothetical protein
MSGNELLVKHDNGLELGGSGSDDPPGSRVFELQKGRMSVGMFSSTQDHAQIGEHWPAIPD